MLKRKLLHNNHETHDCSAGVAADKLYWIMDTNRLSIIFICIHIHNVSQYIPCTMHDMFMLASDTTFLSVPMLLKVYSSTVTLVGMLKQNNVICYMFVLGTQVSIRKCTLVGMNSNLQYTETLHSKTS